MEALLEREGNVDSWNDERLGELSGRMDDGFKEMRAGFARVDQEMKEGFAKVDQRFVRVEQEMREGFARLDDRFFKLMVVIIVLGGGILGALITGILAGTPA